MKEMFLDLETYSDIDLSKSGVYRYVDSPTFRVLLFGYSVDGGEVQVVDLVQGEELPKDVKNALTDENVIKTAHNSNFERICLSRWLGLPTGEYLDPAQWQCSMVWSAYLGLPMSLKDVGTVLGLEKQKLEEGKDLIRLFCIPDKNGNRRLPQDYPEKWELFKQYNKRDVETEMEILSRLKRFPVLDFVWDEYHQDQEINDRGIRIDRELVKQAISMDELTKAELNEKLQELTMLDNPNSVMQMKQWLAEQGLEMDSLGKKEVAEALKTCPQPLADVLMLRQQLSKSSVKKYQAMENCVCSDGRCRGMFQFYGANRSGRFSGKLIQLQNLYRNDMDCLDEAREMVKSGDYEAVRKTYGNVSDVLSQLIRTAFVPYEGGKFIVADFSAIEARVIAWLAGEKWRQDFFAQGGDIYCKSASQMFGVPVEKHGVNGHLRQKGKIAELACGFGGSSGALKAMGALEMGLKEEELRPLVDAWRKANPHIVRLWWDVDTAVKTAVRDHTSVKLRNLNFRYEAGFLIITLPSGRALFYVKPRIAENQFGSECATYMGIGSTKKWERIESYGPKFVENCVQGIARDILCYAMQTLRCCRIVAHVHDEVIIEADPQMSLEAVCEQMGRTPPWAKGLLLRADGYECQFYKKD